MNIVTMLKGFGTLSKKFDIPVYANRKTWLAMPNEMDKVAKQSGNSRVSKSSSDTYRINVTGYTENISEAVLKVIRENTEKDIAKHIDGGVLVYSIGVFSDKAEADKLAALIDKAANGGESKESLESIVTL